MYEQIRRVIHNLTPEKTHAWTLAFYPALTAIAVGYMLVTRTEITPEIVGLFVGLLTAGSLRAVIKTDEPKNGDVDDKSSSDRNTNSSLSRNRPKKLGEGDRGRPNNSRSRNGFRLRLHWYPIFRVS